MPILHLNGYKIANPCFLARIPEEELRKLVEGLGYKPYYDEGNEPTSVHQQLAETLDAAIGEIKQIQTACAPRRSPRSPARRGP